MLYMAGIFTPNQIGPGKVPGPPQSQTPEQTVKAVLEVVPEFYEAVGTVPHRDVDLPPNTVFEVSEEGYRMDDRILRPARVIVAI